MSLRPNNSVLFLDLIFSTLDVMFSRYSYGMNDGKEYLKHIVSTLKEAPQLLACLVALVIGFAGLVAGIFLFLNSKYTSYSSLKDPGEKSHQETQLTTSQNSTSLNSTQSAQLVVDVSGAVKKPGIYTLTEGARVFNALELAGGLSKDADLGFIYKEINLADKIKEGQKLYFPVYQKETDSDSSSKSEITAQDSLISINSASAEELDLLPGIGEKLASKIIEGRPYQNVEELTARVKIGESVFNKIKDSIKL